MKHIISAAALLAIVMMVGAGCKRRPLVEADYRVKVTINIDTNIINYHYTKDPDLMRVVFFDHETGNYMTQAFVSAQGGDVYVLPDRTYDVLVYNFGTESTFIQNGDKVSTIYATTNNVPQQYLLKLKSRASTLPAAIVAKADVPYQERIVYDPDHFYVGRLEGVYIPLRGVNRPVTELVFDAKTVVETWIVDVMTISGVQYIGSTAAAMSGLAAGNLIAPNRKSEALATVYFDAIEISPDGHLIGYFNTFGANLDVDVPRVLSLVFTDVAGTGHTFNFDVTEQFKDNEKQIIYIRFDIPIPVPPAVSGGGISPVVDEWTDVNVPIVI